jgi:hypothetical protein
MGTRQVEGTGGYSEGDERWLIRMMKKKPTDSLYHLSHGQREPVSYWSALSQRRTFLKKAKCGPNGPGPLRGTGNMLQQHYREKVTAILEGKGLVG